MAVKDKDTAVVVYEVTRAGEFLNRELGSETATAANAACFGEEWKERRMWWSIFTCLLNSTQRLLLHFKLVGRSATPNEKPRLSPRNPGVMLRHQPYL